MFESYSRPIGLVVNMNTSIQSLTLHQENSLSTGKISQHGKTVLMCTTCPRSELVMSQQQAVLEVSVRAGHPSAPPALKLGPPRGRRGQGGRVAPLPVGQGLVRSAPNLA